MHELGHIIMNHKGFNQKNEQDANYFASNILAPRMVIHYSGCKNANQVARHFDISYKAAEYAFDDYRRWRRVAVYRMSTIDKLFYDHFYNNEYKGFVFHQSDCFWCGKPIYNRPDAYLCDRYFCRYPRMHYTYNPLNDELSAESRFLNS